MCNMLQCYELDLIRIRTTDAYYHSKVQLTHIISRQSHDIEITNYESHLANQYENEAQRFKLTTQFFFISASSRMSRDGRL